MSEYQRTTLHRTNIAGGCIAAAGLGGAFAGLGFAAFWIAVLVGTPLSFLLEYVICRRCGLAPHWELSPTGDTGGEEARGGTDG